MNQLFKTKDRSIQGGTARWFAVSVVRGWKAQAKAFVGAIVVTWPALLLAFLYPPFLAAYVATTSLLVISSSAVFRQYEFSLPELFDEMTESIGISQRANINRGKHVYVMLVSGMLFFYIVTYAVTAIGVFFISFIAPQWAIFAAIILGSGSYLLERYMTIEHDVSIITTGIGRLGVWVNAQLAGSVRERVEAKHYQSLAQLTVFSLYGEERPLQNLQ